MDDDGVVDGVIDPGTVVAGGAGCEGALDVEGAIGDLGTGAGEGAGDGGYTVEVVAVFEPPTLSGEKTMSTRTSWIASRPANRAVRSSGDRAAWTR